MKNICKEIQEKLEDYFTDYEGEKEYIVVCRMMKNVYDEEYGNIDCIINLIFINGENKFIDFCTDNIENSMSKNEIIDKLISSIYEKEINWRNRTIKNWRAFSSQKVKSLSLHTEKGNEDKIKKINEELIERWKLVENYKYEVSFYKKFVSALYTIKG